MKEVVIPNAKDMKDGSHVEVTTGPKHTDKVYVSKHKGKFYAVGTNCSHLFYPISLGLFLPV